MKKLTIIFAALLFACSVCSPRLNAQDNSVSIQREGQTYYYLEVYESKATIVGVPTAKTVSINFGREASFSTAFKLTDEKEVGIIQFENAITALNYLGTQGWEVVTTYLRAAGQVCFLLRLDATKHKANAATRAIDKTLDELTLKFIEY